MLGDTLLDVISVLLVKGDSLSRIQGFDGIKLCPCMHWVWSFHIPLLGSLIWLVLEVHFVCTRFKYEKSMYEQVQFNRMHLILVTCNGFNSYWQDLLHTLWEVFIGTWLIIVYYIIIYIRILYLPTGSPAAYCAVSTVWWVRGVCPWGAADKWGVVLRAPLALGKASVRRYLGPGSERQIRGTAGE